MPTVKINEIEYEADDLSDDAKAELNMIQYVDGRLADLQAQTAVLQTARAAYAANLTNIVAESSEKK
jgi:hypothetical protein